MRLGLCSGAAPDASFPDLLRAAARRGLSTLELREADGHGIDVESPLTAAAAAEGASASGVLITGYRAGESSDLRPLARIGELLGAPILIGGRADVEARISCALGVVDEGASAAVVVGKPPGLLGFAGTRRRSLAPLLLDFGQTDDEGFHLLVGEPGGPRGRPGGV